MEFSVAASVAWTKYGPDELRRQYLVREVVPDYQTYFDRWRAQSEAVQAEYPEHLNIPFGPSDAETLDVLLPRSLAPKAPVQLLFHGGYWRALHKDDFSFAGTAGLDAGVISVVVNYELCPIVSFAELVAQARRAFLWVVNNIAKFGGNPKNIYLAGHSAGAHLAAMLLATDWADAVLDACEVRGVCGISGVYDLLPLRSTLFQDDLRLTPDDAKLYSPVLLPFRIRCPILLACGASETSEFLRQSEDYESHCKSSGLTATLRYLSNRNHYSAVDALIEPGDTLCREWCAWLLGR
jgi:arylformamidase